MKSHTSFRVVRPIRPHAKNIEHDKTVSKQEVDSFVYLNRVFNPQKSICYRILWAIFVTGAVCYCSYQVIDRLVYLLSDPVVTEIYLSHNKTVKYPSITVCPSPSLAFYPKLHAEKLKITPSEADACKMRNFHLLDLGTINYTTFWNYTDVKELDAYGLLYSVSQFRVLSNMVSEKRVSTNLGSCLTLTISSMMKFGGQDKMFMAFVSHKPSNCTKQKTGSEVWFLVHDDGIDPKYKVISHGRRLAPSLYTLRLTAKQYNVLDSHRNPCISSQAHDKCYKECIERIIAESLKCKSPAVDHLPLPYCNNFSSLTGYVGITSQAAYETDPHNDCGCIRKCKETIYNFELTGVPLERGGTEIACYFGDNVIEIVTEKISYTFVAFVGDVGGNCGLFLGICILSIIESAESLVLFIKHQVQKHLSTHY